MGVFLHHHHHQDKQFYTQREGFQDAAVHCTYVRMLTSCDYTLTPGL